ncbi:DNA polymerase III subunit delta [Candidatus Methylobacter favarea]|uniref:DNA polymerase III subunit delta n=1 Tax=Candidatus Methylobacter favarea TaxID=2707345 RepID=A0A8S0Y6D4_9GAMM|nr:DNA polymerase III subunit delta [Candidatus Methylobacter favarea]CAA9891083.1 DNA polymerase III subunit delta [Candidatus Methylobacter favarea]
MRLKPEQLKVSLQKKIAPVYFISGDEPLQLGGMADAVRKAARKAGFETREVFSVETGFEWKELTVSAGSLSIFSDKKIIDLRMHSGTPGADGAKALIAYCDRLPEDVLLLVTAGKVAKEAFKSRWLQALDKVGIIIQVWPPERQDLIPWLQQRMQRRGLHAETEGLRILAGRIEGNLLSAVQEIEKLYVLHGAGTISNQQIFDAVADSSRYDVFKLVDSALAADVNRVFKILSGLKAEGNAAPVVLWALTRDARELLKIKLSSAHGRHGENFKNSQIRDNRKQLVNAALNRLGETDLNKILVLSAKADRQIKGQQQGDAWETLLAICLMFASQEVLANTG